MSGTLIGVRQTRVSATEVGETEALARLHHGMQNDFSLMRNFRRTNRTARLGPLSEGQVTGNKLAVPIHDHTQVDFELTSEEARQRGMSVTLIGNKLWLCATLPDDSWRNTMTTVVNVAIVAIISLVMLFLWRPWLVRDLWRLIGPYVPRK